MKNTKTKTKRAPKPEKELRFSFFFRPSLRLEVKSFAALENKSLKSKMTELAEHYVAERKKAAIKRAA